MKLARRAVEDKPRQRYAFDRGEFSGTGEDLASRSLYEAPPSGKKRIAVVSPFVDKRHGTERCVAEQIERLAKVYEIHLFSSRVEDINISQLNWHRVPEIPGPPLVKYVWWFALNHGCRWREQVKAGARFPVVFSAGVNCLDANVILVHHLFADHRERLREQLRLRSRRFRQWPRLIHRRLFYGLIGLLEGFLYRRPNTVIAAISRNLAADIERRFRPAEAVSAIYHGVDPLTFNSDVRRSRRADARRRLGFRKDDFILLLIGNDWEKKGLSCLIASLARTRDLPVSVLIVGNDRAEPYLDQARRLEVEPRLRFVKVAPDVLEFYSAADVCVAPSLYDPFGLPILEAMACGLPVIASRAMGASEVVESGQNGLILEDPHDAGDLAAMIRHLHEDGEFRRHLGEAAATTARNFTWEANARAVTQLFERAMNRSKHGVEAATRKA